MGEKILSNWSGTKVTRTSAYFEPASIDELKSVLKDNQGECIRFVGSNMSPNGIALCPDVVISMRRLDRILSVDVLKKQVVVQAGVLVENLLSELRKHDLTLPNLPSVTGMQIGGLVQTGSHGSGARLGPLNEAVVALKIITADCVEECLDEESGGMRFHCAKCSLGTFGAITEITLRCADAYWLREELKVMSLQEMRLDHVDRLAKFIHVKYHYIPHTESVVVYTYEKISKEECEREKEKQIGDGTVDDTEKKRALLDMYLKKVPATTEEDPSCLTFSELRGKILQRDPLQLDHVKAVNMAELDFWTKSQGSRVDESSRILMLDCGGKQHVKEFTTEVLEGCTNDLDMVSEILQLIVTRGIPAPAFIEQRWSTGSFSPLHPTYRVDDPDKALFTWVGIIMYLCPEMTEGSEKLNRSITECFQNYYCSIVETLGEKFCLNEHLAKIEVNEKNRQALHERFLRCSLVLKLFHHYREEFDPARTFLSKQVAAVTSFDFFQD